MGVMTVREFNANISRAIALVEDGDTIDITKNGRVVAELRPKSTRRAEDPAWRAVFAALMDDVDKGIPFGRSFTHDERNR